ncbi:MAG: PEP-CTERM sorting domain-containing protein [Desulfobacteraceae bacterium]|nr:PEP-CTERM sorting domain-containing protein [Desulfobacteraceae bacterium]
MSPLRLSKSLFLVALIIFAVAPATQAAMFTYAGVGTLTIDGVAHSIFVQADMDTTLYISTDIPMFSEPSTALVGSVSTKLENGTIYIDGYGLFTGASGGLGGVMALNPESSEFEAHFSEFFFDSPGTVTLHTWDTMSFLDYDGNPYGSRSPVVGNPWNLEYGMCAPQIVLDNDLLWWSQILGESFNAMELASNAVINLTLIRQPMPVPEPSTLLLMSTGLFCLLHRKMRPPRSTGFCEAPTIGLPS